MDIPLVSVVMSVFNGEPFVREAVDSILRQSFHDFEFIIIDDGSSDGSESILDGYQRRDSHVRVFHQENKGLIASLNKGCGLARGKYIARMDADDISLDDRLLWQVERMEGNGRLGLLGGAVEWIDATGKALGIRRHPCENKKIKVALGDGSAIWHPTAMMRKEVFDSVGGYRAVVVDAEDYDLWVRIAERFDLANLQAVILKYRIHLGQVSVRRCEQEALSAVAVRYSALARMNGDSDPLDSIAQITPQTLKDLGISDALQGAALARHWLTCIRNMYQVGEVSAARRAMQTLNPQSLKYAENWVACDLRLIEAQLLWRQGEFAAAFFKAIQAILARPALVGRPAKALIRGILQNRREDAPKKRAEVLPQVSTGNRS